MKLNTTKQYLYFGDYYSYTLVTSADELVTVREYTTIPQQVFLDIIVNLNIATGVIGDLIITSTSKMQLNSYLKNVLDKNGEEIYDGGVWKIISTMPILNSFGSKEGYRYNAQLIEGNI